VIDSSVPAVAAGATIGSDTKLDLGPSDHVVFITASGRVVKVSGPFQGPPPGDSGPAGDSTALNILPTLLGQKDQRMALGAVRAVPWRGDAIATTDDALAIDASDGGTTCVFDPAHAVVVHNPKDAGITSARSMSSGAEVTLTWDKGAVSQLWPAALPLTDGDMIAFEQAGAEQAAIATIHVMPPAPGASDVQRALQLAHEGCDDQARSLLAVIAKSAK
jgi:hypothetical protein